MGVVSSPSSGHFASGLLDRCVASIQSAHGTASAKKLSIFRDPVWTKSSAVESASKLSSKRMSQCRFVYCIDVRFVTVCLLILDCIARAMVSALSSSKTRTAVDLCARSHARSRRPSSSNGISSFDIRDGRHSDFGKASRLRCGFAILVQCQRFRTHQTSPFRWRQLRATSRS